ncbi:unnamed protein product, partial [Mesorhabditis spiculigera]
MRWWGCFLLLALPVSASAIQCYSGSQLQMLECPATSCIKQTLQSDTVRYCDGVGVSSICQTYRVLETCEQIPGIGHLCCCTKDLCNNTPTMIYSLVASILGPNALENCRFMRFIRMPIAHLKLIAHF